MGRLPVRVAVGAIAAYPLGVSRAGICRALPALLLLVGVVALPGHSAARRAAGPEWPTPILWSKSVGDPSVVAIGKRRVVIGTGPQVVRAVKDPGKPWTWTDQALSARPSWAAGRGDIWAADLARIRGRWVLYYSVPVAGLGEHGRCIGIAVAKRALDGFRPVGSRPLVCPARAKVPRAADPVRAPGLPKSGVIDPSLHTERGRRFLLYKTDGRPSSIRLLPLTRNGLKVRRGADRQRPSTELLRAAGVIENPVLVKRRSDYYLFLSEGDFARCSYQQTWRRSRSLTRWSDATGGVLLTRARTGGLCGPAGGDVVVARKRATLYFHAWVKPGTTKPMGRKFWAWGGTRPAVRALYAARLRFPGKVPTVGRFLG